MSPEQIFAISDSAAISALFWITALVMVMYLGRTPARRAIGALARIFHNGLRLGATSAAHLAAGIEKRNREVLLATGRETTERIIEREFERISATVDRDLARYPETQRLLAETIARIDDDHQNATDVPPEVPGWTKAVEAIGKIPAKADPSVREILEAIHGSVEKAHERSLEAYRSASKKRHRLLGRMMPKWRRIHRTLGDMHRAVLSLLERSRSIDRHIEEYKDIVHGYDRAAQSLASSSLVQFFVATFVIAIAVGGAIINFSLIARPMTEMVGGTSYIGSFRTADIAALVIILVEMSMGLFLMESLRITRLFPVVAALPDRIRVRMIWITLGILVTLATVEAGLAYMREILLADELATTALLRGGDSGVLAAEALWITTAAQMGMGFILPFALTFVAIPLETFVHTLRTVLGMLAVSMLRALAVVLRVTGAGIRQLGSLSMHVYDLVIFAPLWCEGWWEGARQRRDIQRRAQAAEKQEHVQAPVPNDEPDFPRYGEVTV